MSEIKGQLLGIILVIMVFGIVAASLTTIFTNLSNSVSSEVAKAVSQYGSIWNTPQITAEKAVFKMIEDYFFLL